MDWRLVAVALAVTLAGCATVLDDPSRTETVTPAPVSTPADGSSTGSSLPPGVTGTGVADPRALLDAHRRAIEDRSYTLRVCVTSGGQRAERLLRFESPERYYHRDTEAGSAGTRTAFADGTRLYVRTNRSGSVRYDAGNATAGPSTPTTRLLKTFLQVDNATVSKTRLNAGVGYEIRATYDAHPTVAEFRNYSVLAVVTPEGRLQSVTASYTRTTGGLDPVDVFYSFQYTEVGSTTVTRPTWVEREFDGADGEIVIP